MADIKERDLGARIVLLKRDECQSTIYSNTY